MPELSFDPRSGHMRFVVRKVAQEQFFRVLLFLLPILIPPTAPRSLTLSSTPLSLDADIVVEESASKGLHNVASQRVVLYLVLFKERQAYGIVSVCACPNNVHSK
jgi:hypothetical protein